MVITIRGREKLYLNSSVDGGGSFTTLGKREKRRGSRGGGEGRSISSKKSPIRIGKGGPKERTTTRP